MISHHPPSACQLFQVSFVSVERRQILRDSWLYLKARSQNQVYENSYPNGMKYSKNFRDRSFSQQSSWVLHTYTRLPWDSTWGTWKIAIANFRLLVLLARSRRDISFLCFIYWASEDRGNGKLLTLGYDVGVYCTMFILLVICREFGSSSNCMFYCYHIQWYKWIYSNAFF